MSESSHTWVAISQCTRLTLGTCSAQDGGGLWMPSVEVHGFRCGLGFPLSFSAKVVATTISLRHFLQVWFPWLQRVHCFSLFCFSTTSSAIPSCAFFQSVCSSFELFPVRVAIVVRRDFHGEVLLFGGL